MAGSDVVIKVVGDSKKFDDTMKGVESRASATADKMGSVGGKMTKGLTLPILGAAAAMIGLATKAGENADRLLDMSAQTGITTDKLQEYEFVAGQAGVSTDFFKKAAEAVIKDLDKVADGVGPAAEAYASLGVDVLDASGEMRDAGDITEDLMDALMKIENPTLRAATAQDIFKGANQDMLAVLSQGTDAIDDQRQAAHDLGAVQSGEALDGANNFRMGMENLKSQVGGIVGELGGAFAPILSDVVLPLIVDHVVPAIRKFAEFVTTLSDKFQNLSPKTKGFIGGLIGAAAVAGPLLIAGGKMVKMFSGIGKAFGVLSKIMSVNPWVLLAIAVVALVVLVVKNWDKITAAATAVWEWVTDKFQAIIDFLVSAFMNFTPLGQLIQHWDDVKDAAAAAWTLVKDMFDNIINFLVSAFLNFTPLGQLIQHWDDLKEAATVVLEWVTDKFQAIIDWFVDAPGKVVTATAGLFDGIKDAFRNAINWMIDAWNNLSFTFPSFTGDWNGPLPGGAFEVGGWTLDTPNIPRLHQGGVFNSGRGQGLALLQDGETVLPRGAAGGITINVSGFVGSEARLAAEIDRILTRRQRRGALGFA